MSPPMKPIDQKPGLLKPMRLAVEAVEVEFTRIVRHLVDEETWVDEVDDQTLGGRGNLVVNRLNQTQ